jgi:hypothetical protein
MESSDDEIEVTKEQATEAVHQFHLLYGAMMAEWSRLEGQLFHWFQFLTGMNEKLARGVFFSAHSFNGRADVLNAALSATYPTGPVKDFLGAVLKKARGYAGFRNAATHGESHINVQRGSPTAGQMVIIQGSKMSDEAEPTMITMRDLAAARDIFETLVAHLFAALPHAAQPSLLAACRELVLELPNQIRSSEQSPTPSKPKPPQKPSRA